MELLRRRPPRPAEPRHSPAPSAADGKRSAQNRAVECAADLDAGNAGILLRRRNRHGRQCFSRRSRRCAYANAVVVRPQRRIFPSRPGAPLFAADHGLGLWVRGGQCRGAKPLSILSAELAQATDRSTPVAACFWTRYLAISLSLEPEGDCLFAQLWRRDRPLCRQFVALSASGRTRSVGLARTAADRVAGAQRIPADRRTALYAHVTRLHLFLVRALAECSGDREPACCLARIVHPSNAAWLGGPLPPAQFAAAGKRRRSQFSPPPALVRGEGPARQGRFRVGARRNHPADRGGNRIREVPSWSSRGPTRTRRPAALFPAAGNDLVIRRDRVAARAYPLHPRRVTSISPRRRPR